MKIEITYTKRDGIQFELDKAALRLSKDDLACFLDEAIRELQNQLISLQPNNDHL